MAHTVLIVDDSASVRFALRKVFNREADFDVCGEAENGQEAIRKAKELHPELIVLDLFMPVMNGFEAARYLEQIMPSTPLIFYSLYLNGFFGRRDTLRGRIGRCLERSECEGTHRTGTQLTRS